ncbi:MAG: hypothetical protein NXI13_14675 [Proteobacteria bacterium]|nr:hypothetical protein [Pseudomonadota bacterium]
MNKLLSVLVGAAGAAILFVAPANAISVSWNTIEPLVDSGVPVINGGITGDVSQGETGSVSGQRRSPWENTALPGGTYTNVKGDSTAQWNFDGGEYRILNLMWGSLDTYNYIEFYYFDGATETLVDSLDGDDPVFAGAPYGIDFINAIITTDTAFNRFKILSGRNSFELANVSISAVPLPAALPLYGAGLAVMGFVGWRKRKKAAAAVA